MTGNCHVRFLEGRASAIGSGYSIFWDAVERERRESRGCTGTAAPCESESHLRRLHAGSRSTEARGTDQPNWIKLDHEEKRRVCGSLLFCWCPRRDLNPCYRRECVNGRKQTGSRCNYKAVVALQRPVKTKDNVKEHLLVVPFLDRELLNARVENCGDLTAIPCCAGVSSRVQCLRQNKRGDQRITPETTKGLRCKVMHRYCFLYSNPRWSGYLACNALIRSSNSGRLRKLARLGSLRK
jgi:hypothetical protein